MTALDWQPSELQQQRDAYRRGRSRRSVLVALGSSAVLIAVLVSVVGSSSGWGRVRDSFFDVRTGWHDVPALLRALWINLQMMLISEVFILAFAATIAVLRTLRGPVFFPVRFLATVYVDVFRGLPVLIVLYVVGFGVPGLRLAGAPDSPFVLCIIALVLTYTAYVAEVFRAGIESVHPSQRAAAHSLGLSHRQSMRLVILPQAVRRVLPPLLNDFVALQKDVGLISVLGAVDAIRAAQIEAARTFNFTPYVVAGLLFVLLAIPTGRIADAAARRAARRQEGL
jgi:polar amino acid transport system permease protein